jgi:hypothetical protein
MAMMYPNTCDHQFYDVKTKTYKDITTSPGEWRLFEVFKREQTISRNWRVFHGLIHPGRVDAYDADGNRLGYKKRSTECDFLVIIPDLGILVIEVKSSKHVFPFGAGFILGPDAGRAKELKRELEAQGIKADDEAIQQAFGAQELKQEMPMEQAQTAMFARKKTVERAAGISLPNNCVGLMWHRCVIFTDDYYDSRGRTRPQDWLDKSDFEKCNLFIDERAEKARKLIYNEEGATKLLKKIKNSLRMRKAELEHTPPDIQLTVELTKHFCGIYIPNPVPKTPGLREHEIKKSHARAWQEQWRLIAYTYEKVVRNQRPRVIVDGLAGSGKTVLALESARRFVKPEEKLLFLCFNVPLANRLKEELKPILTENSQVTNIDGYKPPVVIDGINPTDHLTTLEKLKLYREKNGRAPFDWLIIDEAQDILNYEYYELIDELVEGGFQNGKCLIFGDFSNQILYSNPNDVDDLKKLLHQDMDYYLQPKLEMNLRNPDDIGGHISQCTNVKYEEYLIKTTVKYPCKQDYYNNQAEQLEMLAAKLQELKTEQLDDNDQVIRRQVEDREIVVLSRTGENQSREPCAAKCLNETEGTWKNRFVTEAEEQRGNSGILYMSIDRFKGLERPYVIITDIGPMDEDMLTDLCYVGMTRATLQLYTLCHAEMMPVFLNRMAKFSTGNG